MTRVFIFAALGAVVAAPAADAACCYFSAKNADILQPAQKVFITWEPATKTETFTVQPKFEGNALDFGMVIPTPSQPKLHEMGSWPATCKRGCSSPSSARPSCAMR